MSQELNQDELNALTDLLLISQKIKEREALCIKIGISYYRELGFMYESSDSSFATILINHLHEVGNTQAICQLCCKELLPIFQGTYKSFLKEIIVKLDCNHDFGQNSPKNKTLEQSSSPMPSSVPEFGVTEISTTLTPLFLKRCEQELTHYIGPIAHFILEDTLAQHPRIAPQELLEILSTEIPDPQNAKQFKEHLL